MGLLQNLAAIAIRNKVISHLRNNCPAEIKDALETLLNNKEAVTTIQNLVTEAMQSGATIKIDTVTSLPFPAEIKQLFADTPKLVTYLAMVARSAGKK